MARTTNFIGRFFNFLNYYVFGACLEFNDPIQSGFMLDLGDFTN